MRSELLYAADQTGNAGSLRWFPLSSPHVLSSHSPPELLLKTAADLITSVCSSGKRHWCIIRLQPDQLIQSFIPSQGRHVHTNNHITEPEGNRGFRNKQWVPWKLEHMSRNILGQQKLETCYQRKTCIEFSCSAGGDPHWRIFWPTAGGKNDSQVSIHRSTVYKHTAMPPSVHACTFNLQSSRGSGHALRSVTEALTSHLDHMTRVNQVSFLG